MSDMLSPFKDIEHNRLFTENGFFTFPLLSENETDFIANIYNSVNGVSNRLHQEQFYGVNYSLGTLTAEENSRIMAPVMRVLQIRLDEYFTDFEVLGCVFITKPPLTNTTFVYHQDWSYTDENKYAFATCWVPLCDTSPANGGMSVLKGSHRFFETYRSDTLDSARITFDEIPQELRTNIQQKKGSCLAFHQAIFHGSYPNVTHNSRPVLAFVVKPKSAPIIHCVKNNSHIDVFEMSTAAFNDMLTQIPKGKISKNSKLTEVIEHIPDLPSASELVIKWRLDQPEHKLIKDHNLHRTFIENGYLIIPQIIKPETINALKQIYHSKFTTTQGMFVTHHYETDAEKNKSMSDTIFDLLKEMLGTVFADFQALLSHFASKGIGEAGLFNLHQDWSIIEEELYGVLHCWIPLQDVNPQNGTLALLPCSHLLFHNYRSGSCPIRFTSLNAYQNSIKHISAKVGDMVVYHPALFHGSGANYSDSNRLAVVAAIAHKEAKRIYYHRQENRVKLFELNNEDLFGRLDYLAKGGQPKGEPMYEVPYRVLDMDDTSLQTELSGFNEKMNVNVEV